MEIVTDLRILNQVSEPVTEFPIDLNLVDEMKRLSHKGCGISAIQLGVPKQILLIWKQFKWKADIIVNPKVISISDETVTMAETCLSRPDITAVKTRPVSITIEAQTQEGKPFTATYKYFYARVLSHELDHLKGVTV